MKKRLIFVLALMMCACVILVACDNNNGNKGSNDSLFGKKEITQGFFTESSTPQEICDKISEGNYTILFTEHNYSTMIDIGGENNRSSGLFKFAKDYVAIIFDVDEIAYEYPEEDWSCAFSTYDYFLKVQDITYCVNVTIDVYPEYCLKSQHAMDISSYEEDFSFEKYKESLILKEVKNLIIAGNYIIDNGNIKLIDTDKNFDYSGPSDLAVYFNNAIIFDVGTTEATLIDECKNWRDWLNSEE